MSSVKSTPASRMACAAGTKSCAPFIGSSRPEVISRSGPPPGRMPSARRAMSASVAIVAVRIRPSR